MELKTNLDVLKLPNLLFFHSLSFCLDTRSSLHLMSTHSFVTEDTNIPPVSSTPEPSRRYIQWKEEDIGLLLKDLEQPGHYNKWKENKSGYSKRVGEQIFKNNMNHEAIKFKVRWLESRFKRWDDQLTSPDVKDDQVLSNEIRGIHLFYQMLKYQY